MSPSPKRQADPQRSGTHSQHWLNKPHFLLQLPGEGAILNPTTKGKNQKFKELNPKSHSPEVAEIETKSKAQTPPIIAQTGGNSKSFLLILE